MQSGNQVLQSMQDRFLESSRRTQANREELPAAEASRSGLKYVIPSYSKYFREDIVKLERTLAAEIKRRVESTKALQDVTSSRHFSSIF